MWRQPPRLSGQGEARPLHSNSNNEKADADISASAIIRKKSSRKFAYIEPRSTRTAGAEICTRGTLTRTRGHTTELNIAGSKRARATCASIRARFASIRAIAASSRADIASILAMPVWLRAIFVWKRATAVATRQDAVCSCAAVILACVKNQSARPAANASTGLVRLSIRSTT